LFIDSVFPAICKSSGQMARNLRGGSEAKNRHKKKKEDKAAD
jgi:hypothetical protein